jgi:hypothetical protein
MNVCKKIYMLDLIKLALTLMLCINHFVCQYLKKASRPPPSSGPNLCSHYTVAGVSFSLIL